MKYFGGIMLVSILYLMIYIPQTEAKKDKTSTDNTNTISGQIVTTGDIGSGDDVMIPGVSMDDIYTTRYGRVDDARTSRDVQTYTPADDITHTAQIRAEHLATTNTIKGVHKRDKKDAAYNRSKINKRFVTNGSTGTRFSESVGWGGYSCADTSGTGCTTKLIKSIKGTYIFFMQEEFKKYQPHYLSVVSPAYTDIGLGIAINRKTQRYRVVMHVKKD